MYKVLIVEDDTQIAKSLSMSLGFSGFEVAIAGDCAGAWERVTNHPYDILLLDVNLPDGSGIDLCQRIRSAGKGMPILFLSARTDEETVVQSMEQGGDDYIRKPFGTEELKARMNKLIQRVGPVRNYLAVGPLQLDLENRSATLGGQLITFGRRELDILAMLVKKAGDVVTRDSILTRLEHEPDIFDRTIDSHISHLRKKFRDARNEEIKIVSVYGIGYRLQWTPGES
jgi:DNA-binding response OmpR family regulator